MGVLIFMMEKRGVMKKNYKLITSIIMLTAFIMVADIKAVPASANYTANINISTNLGIDKFIQPELQNYKLITSLPAKGIFVYGKKVGDRPYFDQVLVKTPSSQKEYNWKATMKNPRVFTADITGSGRENIVVEFVTAYGTGFIESKVHVVDMALSREIPVEDPVEALQRSVRSSVQGQEIVFSAGGREYRVRPKAGAGGIQREYNNLNYGSIVSYVVEGNQLKATVTAGTPYNPFLGEFTLVYAYRDGKLVPQVANFISLA